MPVPGLENVASRRHQCLRNASRCFCFGGDSASIWRPERRAKQRRAIVCSEAGLRWRSHNQHRRGSGVKGQAAPWRRSGKMLKLGRNWQRPAGVLPPGPPSAGNVGGVLADQATQHQAQCPTAQQGCGHGRRRGAGARSGRLLRRPRAGDCSNGRWGHQGVDSGGRSARSAVGLRGGISWGQGFRLVAASASAWSGSGHSDAGRTRTRVRALRENPISLDPSELLDLARQESPRQPAIATTGSNRLGHGPASWRRSCETGGHLPADEKCRFEAKVRELTARLRPSLVLPLQCPETLSRSRRCSGEIERQVGPLRVLIPLPGLSPARRSWSRGDYSADQPDGFRPGPLRVSAYSLAPALPPTPNPCSTRGPA